ncbi:hypothetical protein ACFLQN_00810 [Candidatus Aenigmatarchaeota archaeon]
MKVPAEMCIKCKASKMLCGWKRCPLLEKIKIAPRFAEIGEDFFGPSPSVFVGRFGYPNVFVGPMATISPETTEKKITDSPSGWFGTDYMNIIEMRSLTIRSKHKENIFSRSRIVSDTQDLALAKKPTDIELGFAKKPVYKISLSDVTQPMGPSALLRKLRVTENISIKRKVENIVNDELKTTEQSKMLYDAGEDVYKITTVLSSGLLGADDKKKIVPTRWSITATDDILTKNMITEVKKNKIINDYLVFESEYLGNHFLILLTPDQWEYEGFEAWSPRSFWSQNLAKPIIVPEYEPYKGRTTYADKQGGGYYAARFGVVEYLHKRKKQARAVVFREISEKYVVPLGVWVVRETARNAMKNKPMKFETLGDALKHIGSKLSIPIDEYKKNSIILKRRTLKDFLVSKKY